MIIFIFKDNGDTVLHIACRRKDFESAKQFVEHSADVDAKNVRSCFFC